MSKNEFCNIIWSGTNSPGLRHKAKLLICKQPNHVKNVYYVPVTTMDVSPKQSSFITHLMCYGLHVCVLKVHMNSVSLKTVSNGASLYLGAYYIIKVASLEQSYLGQRSRLHGRLSQNITEFRTLSQAVHKCIQVQLLPSNSLSVVRMSCILLSQRTGNDPQ